MTSGYPVTVYEKSWRPGGRVSTRRTEGFAFDHGAQYLTAADSDLLALIEGARQSGSIAPWEGRLVALANGAAETFDDHRTRWVGVPGMTALARQLANDLDVRCGHCIAAVEPRRRAGGFRPRDSNQTASGKPGAVQSRACRGSSKERSPAGRHEESDDCIVPRKPRTKPSDIGGGDGGEKAVGRRKGTSLRMSRTQSRN